MSRISTIIRAYVNDPSVAEHYGKWGALRPDQRRQIRELCDTCDMFEKMADEFDKENKRLKKESEIFADIGKMYSEIKTEAYKEFAEAYKDQIKHYTGMFTDEGFMVNLEAILNSVDFICNRLVGEDK